MMEESPVYAINKIINEFEELASAFLEYHKNPRQFRSCPLSFDVISQKYIQKDNELREEIKKAKEQELIQSKIDLLKVEVKHYDTELHEYLKSLREAESLLANGIYQAKQKMSLINRAQKNPIVVDELIKYAHKISSDHSVASPNSWEPGDPRRPYPTDAIMRASMLANFDDVNYQNLVQQQANMQQNQYNQQNLQNSLMNDSGSIIRPGSSASNSPFPHSMGNQFDQVKSSIPQSHNNNFDNYPEMKQMSRNEEYDVEVMSTDSSSSSSSDSQ